MKLRVALAVTGMLVVLVSGIVIYAVFFLSNGHLTGPGLMPPSGEQVIYVADHYAGLVTARVLAVLLPVLGIGVFLAGAALTRQPQGANVFLVVAGLILAVSGLVIVAWGHPTQFQTALPDATFSRMFINVRVNAGYYILSAAMLPFGIVTMSFGVVGLFRLRRASRPVPAIE